VRLTARLAALAADAAAAAVLQLVLNYDVVPEERWSHRCCDVQDCVLLQLDGCLPYRLCRIQHIGMRQLTKVVRLAAY
jgi:hypothetical protein